MNDRFQLEQAIAHLESQRGLLGDAATDIAIAGVKQKLSTLEKQEQSGRERKLVTILFADISGFTALAEKMALEMENGC